MGIYLNPGNENFKRTLTSEIYIDKTLMIRETNHFIDTGNNYVCVSRPRRFGKTMASEMLSAYYSKGCDSSEVFKPYKIASDASYEGKLNKYNVIKIDVNSEYQNVRDKDKLISTLTDEIKRELKAEFRDVPIEDDDSLAKSMLRIYEATGETFVIIMDEYDVLVRERVSQGLFDEYLSFLNGMFKSTTVRPAISLAYLTGILPVVRDKIQSKLNNFQEYTILFAENLAEYIGFTSEEVRNLCREWGADFKECKRWYDGYSQQGIEIYNPKSVVEAVRTKRYSNYWSKTSSYQAITDMIEMNFDGTKDDIIRMLAGESVEVDTDGFLNTMTDFKIKDDVFTYLIHLGYLAYNLDDETCRIPNWEINKEWQRAISRQADYSETNKLIKASRELLDATIRGDSDAVAAALDISHVHVTSNRSYNNEDALQSAIYLAYIYALNEYTIIREMTAGRGFADVVFVPFASGRPAMIIELKRNECTESAIAQIRSKRYFDSLAHYMGDLLFVGINYDEKEKTHTCEIERFEKE